MDHEAGAGAESVVGGKRSRSGDTADVAKSRVDTSTPAAGDAPGQGKKRARHQGGAEHRRTEPTQRVKPEFRAVSASLESSGPGRGQVTLKHRHLGLDTGRKDDTVTLCRQLVLNGECQFGETCRYSHDVSAYLAAKPADLGPECIVWTRYGQCPAGVTCRFGAAHIDQATSTSIVRADASSPAQHETNEYPSEFPQALRRRLVDFSDSESIAAGVTAEVARYQDALNGRGTGRAAYVEPRAPSKPALDWSGKLYLAPLTTVGNLPYRRLCKQLGADITCSEMAMAAPLLAGDKREWALLRRHASEDMFGIQVAGSKADEMARVAQLLGRHVRMDFVDINCGCPLDAVVNRGAGAGLPPKERKLESIVRTMDTILPCPVTIKIRTGLKDKRLTACRLVRQLSDWNVAAVTLHGRTRQQRYTRQADWDYIQKCAAAARPVPLFGNGDILSYEETDAHLRSGGVSGVMLARGALIKPWVFTELKERRHWDISASERLELMRQFTNFGLEHYGSDSFGVAQTRRFLLEWMSFTCRYVPVGVLETLPQQIGVRTEPWVGRNDMETLLAGKTVDSWIRVSEMLLGPVPDGFRFTPKHKSAAYPGDGDAGRSGKDWG